MSTPPSAPTPERILQRLDWQVIRRLDGDTRFNLADLCLERRHQALVREQGRKYAPSQLSKFVERMLCYRGQVFEAADRLMEILAEQPIDIGQLTCHRLQLRLDARPDFGFKPAALRLLGGDDSLP